MIQDQPKINRLNPLFQYQSIYMIASTSFNILFFFAAWIFLLRLKFVSIVTDHEVQTQNTFQELF